MAKVSTRNRNKNKFYKDGRAKKPNWEYRFEMAKIDGKRQHASQAGFSTQKEAETAGAKALAEYLNGGQIYKPNEISLSDYLDQWIEQYVMINLRPNTQKGYKNVIKNHIKPSLGQYKLHSLNPSTLQSFVNDQKEKGFKRKHVEAIVNTLKSALTYAIEPLQLIQSNPMSRVKLPKTLKEPRKRIVLTNAEWNAITNRFPFESKYHIALQIGYHTGLRIGEVLGLTWNDIDLESGLIAVNKQQIRYKPTSEKAVWCITPPKTKASIRNVKIGKTLIDLLKKEQLRQKQNRLACGEYYKKYKSIHLIDEIHQIIESDTDELNLICVSEDGTPLTSDGFRYCARVIKAMGIQFDYHCLRHTHATMLAENGVNPKTLQMRLGHENIQTTLQTYIHDTESMQDETVNIFERLVCGQK